MIVEGNLKVIYETEDIGTSGFQKRDCVVTTNEQYPQDILVQFIQDKCNLLTSFQIGEEVKIDINLRGREWVSPQGETKYFNTIQGWRISSIRHPQQNSTAPQASTQTNPQQMGAPLQGEEDVSDLPF